jgi:hypothetical protein
MEKHRAKSYRGRARPRPADQIGAEIVDAIHAWHADVVLPASAHLSDGGVVEPAAFRASLALPSAGSKVFSLRVHRGRVLRFIQGEGADRPDDRRRPLRPFPPLSDYKRDSTAIVVSALDQISGGVDKIRNVDGSERIGAGDFEAIARSRSFQRFCASSAPGADN